MPHMIMILNEKAHFVSQLRYLTAFLIALATTIKGVRTEVIEKSEDSKNLKKEEGNLVPKSSHLKAKMIECALSEMSRP